ncbi:MAG: aminotransferase class III-fold pyridoxal phosphate-dependent enzyme, partial [Bacteroidota bacterium]
MHVNQGEALPPPRSDDPLLKRDAAVFLHQALSTPVGNWIARAEGAYIYDGQGRAYLDLHGNGVHTVGYHNPAVVEAIQRQLAEGLCFAPRRYTNRPAVELAEKLAALAPGDLNRVLFCPGGSQAIEMAIMLAKLHTGRHKTLSFRGTFHGSGFQAISVGADPHFVEGVGPLMPGALHLELPDYARNPWGLEHQREIDEAYLAQLDDILFEHPDIAAFVSEPVFYNSTVPSRYYWQQVHERCDAHGILLIFDEIYTALGRTGTFFAAEQFVEPDILVIGKGFGGGMLPFAGIIAREGLNQQRHKSIGHFTHEKNP